MTQPAGPVGRPSRGPRSPGAVAPEGVLQPAPAAAPFRGRTFWALVLLFPGGALLAAGLLIALPGAALVNAALRRLTAAFPGSVPAPEREQGQGDSWSRVSSSWPNGLGKEVN